MTKLEPNFFLHGVLPCLMMGMVIAGVIWRSPGNSLFGLVLFFVYTGTIYVRHGDHGLGVLLGMTLVCAVIGGVFFAFSSIFAFGAKQVKGAVTGRKPTSRRPRRRR